MQSHIRIRNDRDNWKRLVERMNYLPELTDLLDARNTDEEHTNIYIKVTDEETNLFSERSGREGSNRTMTDDDDVKLSCF
jgi:hypothetical protein